MSYESNPESVTPNMPYIMQSAPEVSIVLVRRQFWLFWLGATAASALVGGIINHFLRQLLSGDDISPYLSLYATGFLAADLQGLAQGFIVQRFFPQVPFWIWPVATAIGIEVGYFANINLPVAGVAFSATLACFTGALIPLLVGPLLFVQKRLEGKPAMSVLLTFAVGIISYILSLFIAPIVEDTVSGNQGLYLIVRATSSEYVLAIFIGLAQWVALRTFMPKLSGWVWVIASVVGGSFAGLIYGVFSSVTSSGIVGEVLIHIIASTVAAVGTGYVLVQMLTGTKRELSESEAARRALG